MVGGRVAAAGLMVLAGLGMTAPCGVVPVSVVSCGVIPARVVPCCGEVASAVRTLWCNSCSCGTLLWKSC